MYLDHGWSNLHVIILAFRRVRHVASLHFTAPCMIHGQARAALNDVCRDFSGIARSEIPIGMNLPTDDHILVDAAMTDSWLNFLLDDMNGITAALLRREMFESWCTEYEYRVGRGRTGRLVIAARAVS